MPIDRPRKYVIENNKSYWRDLARTPIPKKLANRVFKTRGMHCHICGLAIPPNAVYPEPLSRSLDHLIPFSKGGKNEFSNLMPAHLKCNSARQARPVKRDRSGLIFMKLDNATLLRLVTEQLAVKVGRRFYQPIIDGFDATKIALARPKPPRLQSSLPLISLIPAAFGIYCVTTHQAIGLLFLILAVALYIPLKDLSLIH